LKFRFGRPHAGTLRPLQLIRKKVRERHGAPKCCRTRAKRSPCFPRSNQNRMALPRREFTVGALQVRCLHSPGFPAGSGEQMC
jgi:hypothetical protein